MRLKKFDMIVVVAIAGINVLWAVSGNPLPVIGVVLALPLVFLLPGYALTEMLFYRRSLDRAHRFIFVLGLSLTVDILGGFILNLLPMGLRAISWAVFLGLLTLIFSLIALCLRRRFAANEMPRVKIGFSLQEYIFVGLSVVITILALYYSVMSAAERSSPGFTQAWMLPLKQRQNISTVRMGIRSFEKTSVTYRITLAANGAQVNEWRSVVLAPQQEWDEVVPISLKSRKGSMYVEVKLYKLDNPEAIYRELHVTLHR